MKQMINSLKTLYIIGSFTILDVWLRVMTRWIGQYSIYELEPNMFTLCWAILLTTILLFIREQKVARVIYGVVYFLWMIYVIVQYGYYLIFDKFLFLNDFLLAGEASNYFVYIKEIINLRYIISILVLCVLGIIGIKIFPKIGHCEKSCIGKVVVCLSCIFAICLIPNMYEESQNVDQHKWDTFSSAAFEYNNFTNSAYDMELTGAYQYVFRDLTKTMFKRNAIDESIYTDLDSYFNDSVHGRNDMTGVFSDKNIIIFMMESLV